MNPLEKLKLEYSKYVSPDDLIKSIIKEMEESTIPKDPSTIHNAVFKLKQKKEFSELLKEFSFDLSGLSPFSELLDRVLFRLEISCILKTPNPSYEKYTINSKEETFEKSFSKFSGEQQNLIREMSKSFSSYIN